MDSVPILSYEFAGFKMGRPKPANIFTLGCLSEESPDAIPEGSSGRHDFQVPLLHFPGLQPYALTYTLHTRLAGEKLSLNNLLESTVLPMEYEILSPKRGPGILSTRS